MSEGRPASDKERAVLTELADDESVDRISNLRWMMIVVRDGWANERLEGPMAVTERPKRRHQSQQNGNGTGEWARGRSAPPECTVSCHLTLIVLRA
jgi:hypothetical protein